MPLLDVSELLFDPAFVETVTVLRREQVMVNGRATTTITTFPDIVASVQPKDTAIGGNVIERAPDGQWRGSNLNIYTKFRLRGVSEDATGTQYQPDIVIWNGDQFLVALTNDWSHYGAGFMHAELESMEAVDYAPDGAP